MEWLSNKQGVFWIQGRPGSGKSTAMKFLLHHPKTFESLNAAPGDGEWQTAGVFFTDRISQVERSWKAVLSSLLYQLVSESTELQEAMVPFSLKKVGEHTLARAYERSNHSWDIRSLQHALLFCKNQQTVRFKICFFVDALDENDEEECTRRSVTEFLMQLATDQDDKGYGCIKLCAASRPENDLSELLSSYSGFKMHEWTRPDIEIYVQDKLGKHPPMEVLTYSAIKSTRIQAKHVLERIVQRAQGVFLWIRLIVQDLRESLTNGLILTVDDLEDRMEETPEKLHEFFAHILRRIPSLSQADSRVLFECVLHAQEPLRMLDVCLILESQKKIRSQNLPVRRHSPSPDPFIAISSSAALLERRIKTCTGGLLQVQLGAVAGNQGHDTLGAQSHTSRVPLPSLPELEYELSGESAGGLASTLLPENLDRANWYDMSRTTIQVLHQTVRESLPRLLKESLGGEEARSTSRGPEINAHRIFLTAHLCWLNIPISHRKKLRPFRLYGYHHLSYHAVEADKLNASLDKNTLDAIDAIQSAEIGTSWLVQTPDRHLVNARPSIKNLLEDGLDLMTFAVLQGMVNYVRRELAENPEIIARSTRRPLLHLVVDPILTVDGIHSINFDMLKLLVESGADVAKRYKYHGSFGTYSAVQRLVDGCPVIGKNDEADHRYYQDALSLLLENGADPNAFVVFYEVDHYVPCVFKILRIEGDWQGPFSMIKCLVKYGANLEASGRAHTRFVDAALKCKFNPPADAWIWLFDKGLKIHSSSIPQLYHNDNKAHSLRTEVCRNPMYYTTWANVKAAHYNPHRPYWMVTT